MYVCGKGGDDVVAACIKLMIKRFSAVKIGSDDGERDVFSRSQKIECF